MIKLIASDMDGTLLNDRKELPGDFFSVLGQLEEHGIKFTVASGRSYDAVAHLFPEEYRAKLDFICDNGANIYHDGKQAKYTPLERATFEQLIRACGEIGGLRVLVCAGRGTYHLEADPAFTEEIATFPATTCFRWTTSYTRWRYATSRARKSGQSLRWTR